MTSMIEIISLIVLVLILAAVCLCVYYVYKHMKDFEKAQKIDRYTELSTPAPKDPPYLGPDGLYGDDTMEGKGTADKEKGDWLDG